MSTNIIKTVEIAGAYDYPENRLNQRERKVLEVSNTFVPTTPGNWAVAPATVDAALNTLAAANSGGVLQTASVTWDFSVNGGTVGVIPLTLTLPDNAIVVEVIRDELVAATSNSSTGTILLGIPTDGQLEQTALTADGGSPTVASTGGTAVPKKTTAARIVQVTIATNNVLAGKIQYFIRYYQGA